MPGKDEGGPRGLMPPAELRAALKRAEAKSASCALGLTKGRDAVILLDRLLRPRKLLAGMKAQAKAAGLDLDLASPRFGRVSVSGKEVAITVNKAVVPAVEQRLKPVMRAAGHPHFAINADPSIEDEPEDGEDAADDADLDGAGDGNASATAAGGAAPAPAAAAPPAPTVPRLSSGPPAAPGGAPRAGSPDAALRARLTHLVRRMSAAVKSGQPGSERLLAAAEAAHGALKSGDLVAAGQGADNLQRLLGGPAAPAGAVAAPAAGGSVGPSTPAPGSTGGDTPPGTDALKAELTGLVGRIGPTIAADPSRKEPLLKIANDANACLKAGDAAGTQAGIEVLRQAVSASTGPNALLNSGASDLASPTPPSAPTPSTSPASPSRSGTDTPEARSLLASRLVRTGIEATTEDADTVRNHIVANDPVDALRLMDKYHVHVQVTRGSVIPEMPALRDVQPRGWGAGSMSKVTGVYDAGHRAAIVATQDGPNGTRRMPDEREHGSIDVVLHEGGHGINRAASIWSDMSNKPDYIDAYTRDGNIGVFSRSYFHQGDDGRAGRDEAWAEGFAMYNRDPGGMQRTYPHMFAYFQKFMASELS